MRLLVWNCAGGIDRKIAVVTSLEPDIAILPEGSPGSASSFPAASVVAIGMTHRGLVAAGFNGWRLESVPLPIPDNLFLPLIASKGDTSLQLLAVCVKQAPDYVTPTLRALDVVEDFIRAAPTILAGDFNQSVVFDRRRGKTRHFRQVIERLGGLGMYSAWHTYRDEEFGRESEPTFHMYWRDSPETNFHIDYAFVPGTIAIDSVNIGKFSDYCTSKLSDHVPLNVKLQI